MHVEDVDFERSRGRGEGASIETARMVVSSFVGSQLGLVGKISLAKGTPVTQGALRGLVGHQG